MKFQTIKKRRDFVLSNKFGKKFFNKNFILQKYNQIEQDQPSLKFGFTATKVIKQTKKLINKNR